ncbi:GntR family transcriptional regulator [Streptomyces sp. NPDC059982]|uniref:GntR family transcriptional regulator n=1 Tax=unclassified Streptomyces TaxID=2593676 RepID=UPI00367EB891
MLIGTRLADHELEHGASVLQLVRSHIRANYRPGARLPGVEGAHRPTAKALASALRLPEYSVVTALRALNAAGEIQAGHGAAARVLGPREMHGDDTAFVATVRQRISSSHYGDGQALPTGLLGDEFRLSPAQVRRALRSLVWDGWVKRDEQGPHGPGYYVVRTAPAHPDPS